MNILFIQKRKFMIIGILIILLVGMTPISSFAAPTPTAAQVTIPSFPITLNGQLIRNEYRQYPLILYKDITYFPMTYDDSRFLGLASEFEAKTGLSVNPFNEPWSYAANTTKNKNLTSYQAGIATFPIQVNGKAVDNSKETYPLLIFRDITYFPLTWHFAVDEFNWQYTFTAKDGLVVTKQNGATLPVAPSVTKAAVSYGQTKDGKLLTTVRIPKIAGSDQAPIAAISGSQVYYQGNDNTIYQAPVANPSMAKEVYRLPQNSYAMDGNTFVSANLKEENGMAVLSYRDGSIGIGSDHQVWLKENGMAEKISVDSEGYTELFGDTKVSVSKFAPPQTGNLSILYKGETTKKPIGDPKFYYGWNTKDCLQLIGDNVYVLANTSYGRTWYLYKVNIKTSETRRVSNLPMDYFKIDGNYIY
ncbi:MAG: hypothetical protein RR361_06385, partial [Anaerovorax sp.]